MRLFGCSVVRLHLLLRDFFLRSLAWYLQANPAMESCFYKFYRMHNTHFVVWCAMHTGEYSTALEYAKKAEAATPAGDENSGVKFMLVSHATRICPPLTTYHLPRTCCRRTVAVGTPVFVGLAVVLFSDDGLIINMCCLSSRFARSKAGVIPMGVVFLESYHTMIWHVWIRFGKWEEILAYPVETDTDVFASSIATAHYAKGVAYASTGRVTRAEEEQMLFLKALENPALAGRVLHNNPMYAAEGPCVLNVQKSMLEGEILYRKAAQKEGATKADFESGFDALRAAVTLSMNLNYNEPWGQMQPVRHALGALLLEQGQVDEALKVYNEDLAMWKGNMWGLLGKKQCLEAKVGANVRCSCMRCT